jgi:hypothetical protein
VRTLHLLRYPVLLALAAFVAAYLYLILVRQR